MITNASNRVRLVSDKEMGSSNPSLITSKPSCVQFLTNIQSKRQKSFTARISGLMQGSQSVRLASLSFTGLQRHIGGSLRIAAGFVRAHHTFSSKDESCYRVGGKNSPFIVLDSEPLYPLDSYAKLGNPYNQSPASLPEDTLQVKESLRSMKRTALLCITDQAVNSVCRLCRSRVAL